MVQVNVILNLQKICTSLGDRYQRKTLFVVDVSINGATDRNWQTRVLDTREVTQLNLTRQERVNQAQGPVSWRPTTVK